MESEEYNIFAKPYKNSVPQDETKNLSMRPPLSTTTQAYHNFGSTPTTSLNPAGSYFYPSWWAYQTWSKPHQYDSLHDPRRPSNYPMAAGGAALAFSEKVQGVFGEKNLDSTKKCDENLQSLSLETKESRENGKRSSIPKTNWEGVTWSAASESMGSPVVGRNSNTDFPSTEKQQSNMMLGNGEDAQKMSNIEYCNGVEENRSIASLHIAENPTELNQNLGTDLNASRNNAQLEKLESSETRKQKKRQSNRESARRSRMQKQKECEELRKTVENLSVKNSKLKNKLLRLSEECVVLTNDNDSILEELVEKYGLESVKNLMNKKPTTGGGGS